MNRYTNLTSASGADTGYQFLLHLDGLPYPEKCACPDASQSAPARWAASSPCHPRFRATPALSMTAFEFLSLIYLFGGRFCPMFVGTPGPIGCMLGICLEFGSPVSALFQHQIPFLGFTGTIPSLSPSWCPHHPFSSLPAF